MTNDEGFQSTIKNQQSTISLRIRRISLDEEFNPPMIAKSLPTAA
jgi:hypothetical protein